MNTTYTKAQTKDKKSSYQEEILKEFELFLNKNHLEIIHLNLSHNMFSENSFKIIKKDNPVQNNLYLRRALFEVPKDNIVGFKKVFLRFVGTLLKDYKKHVWVNALLKAYIQIEPQTFYDDIINLIKDYQPVFLSFIKNRTILKAYKDHINLIIPKIRNIEDKESVIDLWLKRYTQPYSLDVKNKLFNIINKEMKTSKKYDPILNTLIKSYQEDIISHVEDKYECLPIVIDLNKLNSRYIQHCYGKKLVTMITTIVSVINQHQLLNPLSIHEITIFQRDESILVKLFGKDLEAEKIKKFFNILFTKELQIEESSLWTNLVSNHIIKITNEALVESSKIILEQKINNKGVLSNKRKRLKL